MFPKFQLDVVVVSRSIAVKLFFLFLALYSLPKSVDYERDKSGITAPNLISYHEKERGVKTKTKEEEEEKGEKKREE